MRSLLLAAVLLSTGASAQTAATPAAPPTAPATAADVKAAPKSDWVHVQVLEKGTNIHIKTLDHGNIRCAVAVVDAESITCGGVVFKRSSILYIKGSHRLRSTLVGVGVGYGSAAGITYALAAACKNSSSTCVGVAVAAVFIDLGLLIATPIVFGVYDLTAGTIYKVATP